MEIAPDKWQRAKPVFDAVRQQPGVERASFLAVACPEEDPREQVEQLLLNHEQAGSFLSKPVIELPKSERFAPGSILAGRFQDRASSGQRRHGRSVRGRRPEDVPPPGGP